MKTTIKERQETLDLYKKWKEENPINSDSKKWWSKELDWHYVKCLVEDIKELEEKLELFQGTIPLMEKIEELEAENAKLKEAHERIMKAVEEHIWKSPHSQSLQDIELSYEFNRVKQIMREDISTQGNGETTPGHVNPETKLHMKDKK